MQPILSLTVPVEKIEGAAREEVFRCEQAFTW